MTFPVMQNLVEKILRMKIYDSMYWKEHCFGLTAESLVDKAVQINSLGGTCGGARKPTHFICLILKLLQVHVCRCARTACRTAQAAVPELQIRPGSLYAMQLRLPSQHASTGDVHASSLFATQIQPDREIITEYIKNDEFKYVRILGEPYCLVGTELGTLHKVLASRLGLELCRRPHACGCHCCSRHMLVAIGTAISHYLVARPTGLNAVLLVLLPMFVLPALCRSLLPAAGGPAHGDLQLPGTSV